MGQFVAVRALKRNLKLRVTNSAGNQAMLSTTTDVVIDLDNIPNRRALAHHASIGQFVISAANVTQGASGSKSGLPSNT